LEFGAIKSILPAFEPQNFTKSWGLTKFTRFNWFQDIIYYNLENFDQFGWKNWQKRKMTIFWYFTKLEITQVRNDLESWNLAKLWSIIHFQNLYTVFFVNLSIFGDFAVFFQNLAILVKFWTKTAKFSKMLKLSKIAV